MAGTTEGTQPTSLTPHEAAEQFESLLFPKEDKGATPEPAPATETKVEEPKPDPEAGTEQTPGEGESPANDDAPDPDGEKPVPATLDPHLKVKVKIDGVEQEVTLDEALKGYSRTQDYTRKTQELAVERKKFQTEEVPAVRTERQAYADRLKALDQLITENTPKEPDWNDAKVKLNPEQFSNLWIEWQQHKQARDQLAQERQKVDSAVFEDQKTEFGQYVAKEREALREAIPEWKDEAKFKSDRQNLATYAKEKLGFTDDDLGKVFDHRLMVMLNKAYLHDKAQAAKPAIVQGIEKVKVATPGPGSAAKPKTKESTKALQRLGQTGSIDDAAAAFFHMLDDK